MEVGVVSSQITPVIQTETAPQTNPAVEEPPQEQPQSSEIPESEAAEQEENENGQVDGVIRNLLDGHFKGVADVRLRMNYFDALAAIETEALKALAEEEVADVLDAVASGVDNILALGESVIAEAASENETGPVLEPHLDAVESGVSNILGSSESVTAEAEPEDETGLVLETHMEFVDEVNGLKGEFQSAEAPSTDNLINGIQDAFAAFVESLQDLLIPTADSNMDEGGGENQSVSEDGEGQGSNVVAEAPGAEDEQGQTSEISVTAATETPAADGQDPPEPTEPDYQSLIDELGSSFVAAIAELMEALNGFQILPELSDPSVIRQK